MLIDQYLPKFHYSEKHAIRISSVPEIISGCLENLDFRNSRVISFLFWLRGMPAKMRSLEGLTNDGFFELDRQPNKEVVIGLAGQFWKSNGNLQKIAPEDFVPFDKPDFLKGVWNFYIQQLDTNICVLSTETRVYCTSDKSRKKFSRYWFFIKPFSGLIRMEMLRSIKKSSETEFEKLRGVAKPRD
jgi:hypothetical protein